MNAMPLGTAARHRVGGDSDEQKPEPCSADLAWLVLEAANDLGDKVAIEACRRVIDAQLNGRSASESDLHLVVEYFR